MIKEYNLRDIKWVTKGHIKHKGSRISSLVISTYLLSDGTIIYKAIMKIMSTVLNYELIVILRGRGEVEVLTITLLCYLL